MSDSMFYQDKERASTRHDTKDFRPLVKKISEILPPIILVVFADKGYDMEDNLFLVREELYAFSVHLQGMNMYQYGEHTVNTEKRWNVITPKILYNQRNKEETIISVIKRLFGEYIVIQMHGLQYAKVNQPYHNIDDFYKATFLV